MPSDDDKTFSHDDAFRMFGRARQVEGGIKSQQPARRKVERAWWAERWIAVLESFDIGERLSRGRSYARRGQVLHIDIRKGEVKANVQGSRREPYHVTIKLPVLSPEDWRKLAHEFAGKALYAAKLLSRQMPQQIEDAFAAVGLQLFPSKHADLKTACSCPDWSNPCKHIAAVYYLLAEEFDRDPFLIFRLRGMTEDELVGLLDKQLGGGVHERTADLPSGKRRQTSVDLQFDQPISADPRRFWHGAELPADIAGKLSPPDTHAILPRSLGSFPFWRGQQNLWLSLEDIYRKAATTTSEVFTDLVAENTQLPADNTRKPDK